MKTCPYCAESILDEAIKCKHCGSMLPGEAREAATLDASASEPAPAGAAGDTLEAAATISATAIRPGHLLAGRYRVVRQLGAGGMGEVWLAEDAEMDDMSLALKVLPSVLARNRASVDALRREAQIALKLTHQNICRLHTFHSDGDVKFLAMEHIEGRTLEDLLAESGAMRLEELLPLARQLALALDYAHSQTPCILHRDIKPANIMITPDGRAKLMDFGIAREIHDSVTRLSATTSMTPLYASPEQFAGKKMTAASDVYSFAAVLYECLAGHSLVSPHGDVAWQVLQRPWEPLAGQPDHVSAALSSGLAKDPATRLTSAAALVEALAGQTVELQPTVVPPGERTVSPPPPPPLGRPTPPPLPRGAPPLPPPAAARVGPARIGTATLESVGVNTGPGATFASFLAIFLLAWLVLSLGLLVLSALSGQPSVMGGSTIIAVIAALVIGLSLARRVRRFSQIDLALFESGLVQILTEMRYKLVRDHGGVLAFARAGSGLAWLFQIHAELRPGGARISGPTSHLNRIAHRLRARGML